MVLAGAIHDRTSVFLPLGGHRVLPYDDLQARAQSDNDSLLYIWPTRDTRAIDIVATFNFPVVLANSVDYRQWSHPSTREMVRLLSRDMTTKSILFRRFLPPRMLLIDHILWSNIFPLHHIVQRRGAIMKALYRISEGFWFSPVELIMTSSFHFKDKVLRRCNAPKIPYKFYNKFIIYFVYELSKTWVFSRKKN